jgi:microcystin-dependent protein
MSSPYLGEIRAFGFNFPPVGWLRCDGSLQSIANNNALFALLGTTYGGDGVNTFGVPDLRGRLPLHQGQGGGLSSYQMGQVGGTETVTVTAPQMPTHTHALLATTASAASTTPGNTMVPAGNIAETMYATDLTGATASVMSAQSTSTTTGSQPHDNTMPTLTVSYCIASEGIFPARN